MMRTIDCLAVAAMMLAPLAAHAADPFIGKWQLDVKHSTYEAGTCPQAMTIEISQAEHGIHYHSETHLAHGVVRTADYTAAYDESPALVTGDHGVLLPVALQRTGPRTVVAKYISGFQTVATSRRVMSADGRHMTITTSTHDKAGKTLTNVGVYHRLIAALPNGNRSTP